MSGAFCLVLHGHLPWVLGHGRWPHGEDWLFEAASETWLPLLEVLDTCRAEGIRPAWTVGVTPILLEQLASERFRAGLRRWLAGRQACAEADHAAFTDAGEGHLAWLATRWGERFTALRAQFDALGADVVAPLIRAHHDGLIELMTSNATHGYHPLLVHDASARAQVRTGVATSERHLGFRPRGAWLPECAYRPPGMFHPPAIHGAPRYVGGVGEILAAEGIRHIVVDTHLVRGGRAQAIIEQGRSTPVPEEQADWDTQRGWRSEIEPHRLVEDERLLDLTVFARSPDVSEQVWSGAVGYPGDGRYLEFHKRHGQRGLRYWKVTGADADLGDKDHYYPDDVHSAVHSQAVHFVELVRARLHTHADRTGRPGTVCAPFDAELFGHWWHEGPRFLLEVARAMHAASEIDQQTLGEVLAARPADTAVSLPEGSWGAGGDHRVWLNDELRFYWEVAVRAEDRFLDLWHRAPWRTHAATRELLAAAGRELLLLQASDWPFVVSTGGAVDYGIRRIFGHAALLDDLCNGVEDLLADPDSARDAVVVEALVTAATRHPVFPDLDLAWWS